jgi:hypothetical protein
MQAARNGVFSAANWFWNEAETGRHAVAPARAGAGVFRSGISFQEMFQIEPRLGAAEWQLRGGLAENSLFFI